MTKWKDHIRLRYGKFASKEMTVWWGIESIREIRAAVAFLAGMSWIIFMIFGVSFLNAILLGMLVEVIINGILSFISTVAEKRYRLKQEAKDGISYTLNRLSLNKTRKYHGSKTGFEN